MSNEIRQKKVVEEKDYRSDNSGSENVNILEKLTEHINLYDKINQMKYKLCIMENV